jgi:pSer/pThr/pTyr-binding forkhead associated (FHA) protein
MDADSTKVIGQGTADYPMDPLAAQADERCPHCDKIIPAGEQFCAHCGYQRGSWRPAAAAPAAASGDALSAAAAAQQKPPLKAEDILWLLVAADGATYPLALGEWVIGRGAVDIVLPDAFASRSHAKLIVTLDGVELIDLGSANGTYVGKHKLAAQEITALIAGDTVRIGQTDLKLVQQEPGVGPPAESEAALELTSKPVLDASAETAKLAPAFMDLKPAGSPWLLMRGAEIEFEIPYGTSSIGRKPDTADLVLRGDGFVSGLHARLVATTEALEICDLGSTNGTYVNGERCEPSAIIQLKAGDIVRLGQTDLSVAFETSAADTDQLAESAPEPAPEQAQD